MQLPSLLFDGIFNLRSDTGVSYDVHPTGDRFVMVRQGTATTEALSTIRVVLTSFDEVRRLARWNADPQRSAPGS